MGAFIYEFPHGGLRMDAPARFSDGSCGRALGASMYCKIHRMVRGKIFRRLLREGSGGARVHCKIHRMVRDRIFQRLLREGSWSESVL